MARLSKIDELTLKINHMQGSIVVVSSQESYKDYSHAIHIYYDVGVKTRRFYCEEDAEEFLLGILTAFESMS